MEEDCIPKTKISRRRRRQRFQRSNKTKISEVGWRQRYKSKSGTDDTQGGKSQEETRKLGRTLRKRNKRFDRIWSSV